MGVLRQVFTATGHKANLLVAGMSNVGFGLFGTWAGTVTFKGSYDGVTFNTLSVQTYPYNATAVTTATANGSWFVPLPGGLIAVQAVFTSRTSGSVVIAIGASNDGSFAQAFVAPTTIQKSSQSASAGANTVSIAAASYAQQLTDISAGMNVVNSIAGTLTLFDAGATIGQYMIGDVSGEGTTNAPAMIEIGATHLITPGNAGSIVLNGLGTGVTSVINVSAFPA